jgi:hypothetical protein
MIQRKILVVPKSGHNDCDVEFVIPEKQQGESRQRVLPIPVVRSPPGSHLVSGVIRTFEPVLRSIHALPLSWTRAFSLPSGLEEIRRGTVLAFKAIFYICWSQFSLPPVLHVFLYREFTKYIENSFTLILHILCAKGTTSNAAFLSSYCRSAGRVKEAFVGGLSNT